jgi:large subunit ribosomal protein L24
MNKIRKGDEVVVTTGKDKGRRGTVLQILDGERVLVEGINVAKKHQKANPNAMPPVQGGINDKEMPIHVSNVMVFNPKSKKGERIGIRITDSGEKVRIFKASDEVVDI